MVVAGVRIVVRGAGALRRARAAGSPERDGSAVPGAGAVPGGRGRSARPLPADARALVLMLGRIARRARTASWFLSTGSAGACPERRKASTRRAARTGRQGRRGFQGLGGVAVGASSASGDHSFGIRDGWVRVEVGLQPDDDLCDVRGGHEQSIRPSATIRRRRFVQVGRGRSAAWVSAVYEAAVSI